MNTKRGEKAIAQWGRKEDTEISPNKLDRGVWEINQKDPKSTDTDKLKYLEISPQPHLLRFNLMLLCNN